MHRPPSASRPTMSHSRRQSRRRRRRCRSRQSSRNGGVSWPKSMPPTRRSRSSWSMALAAQPFRRRRRRPTATSCASCRRAPVSGCRLPAPLPCLPRASAACVHFHPSLNDASLRPSAGSDGCRRLAARLVPRFVARYPQHVAPAADLLCSLASLSLSGALACF